MHLRTCAEHAGEVAYRMGEKGSWEGTGDKVEQKNKIKQETGLMQTISKLCMTNAFLNFMSKKTHEQWCLLYGQIHLKQVKSSCQPVQWQDH